MRIDAGEHGLVTLEDLIVQAHPDGRQVLGGIEASGLRGGGFQQMVDGAAAGRGIEQVLQQPDDPAVGAVANQDQAQHQLGEPGCGHRQVKKHGGIVLEGDKGLVQGRLGLAFLAVKELAANPFSGRHLG
jgi:hypothetical protein